jgi:oligopeptide transport system ATP-binding protein
MVLYGGRIMESGTSESIFYRPTHPYTVGLLGAVPKLDHEGEQLVAIPGVPPNMARLPAGCPFSERCPFVMDVCVGERPALAPSGIDPKVLRACHRPVEDVRRDAEEVLA